MADINYQPADALTFVGSRCAQFECALEQHENGQLENENILGWLQNLCALKYSDEDILEFLNLNRDPSDGMPEWLEEKLKKYPEHSYFVSSAIIAYDPEQSENAEYMFECLKHVF